jgi:hypothetical protein
MNAREGLERIRQRLDDNGASAETLRYVDTMIVRASSPEMERAQASQTQLIRMLTRTPVARDNFTIYNDLVKLEEEVTAAAARRAAEVQAEADRPLPKSKKYYKQLKERDKRGH